MFHKDHIAARELALVSRNNLGIRPSEASLRKLADTVNLVNKSCQGNEGLVKRHTFVKNKMEELVKNCIPGEEMEMFDNLGDFQKYVVKEAVHEVNKIISNKRV